MMTNSTLSKDHEAPKRAARREQILRAAKIVFAENGYHNASISEIISRAKIARGTFYLYFENKRSVFDSILLQALSDLTRSIKVIEIGISLSPREQVAANLTRVLTFLVDDRPLSQLLLNPGLTPDVESAQELQGFYQRVTALLKRSLEHGTKMGLVRHCDTEVVANALLGAVRGVARRLLDGNPNIDHIVDELLAFGWRAVVDDS